MQRRRTQKNGFRFFLRIHEGWTRCFSPLAVPLKCTLYTIHRSSTPHEIENQTERKHKHSFKYNMEKNGNCLFTIKMRAMCYMWWRRMGCWAVWICDSNWITYIHVVKKKWSQTPNGTVILWRKRVKSSPRMALNHEIEGFYSKQEIGYQHAQIQLVYCNAML